MAYEVEAIADAGSLPTQSSTPIMREERVVEPYKIRAPKPMIGQTDTTGSPTTAAVETKAPEETVRLSPGAAALARRELKFRQQQQALEKDRAAIAAEKAEIAQLRAMKEKLAAKDYSGLEGLVDFNEYSQYQVNKLNGADPRAEELTQLKGKIDSLEKMTQENIEKQFEAAVQERKIAAQGLIDQGSFGVLSKAKELGAQPHEAIVQHIMDTWEHDNKELSIDQAAKEVQMIMLEQAEKWSKLLENEKKAPAPEEPSKKTLPPLRQGLKTLTNQVTAGEFKAPRKSLSHITNDSERWAEARRRAEEKLQNR